MFFLLIYFKKLFPKLERVEKKKKNPLSLSNGVSSPETLNTVNFEKERKIKGTAAGEFRWFRPSKADGRRGMWVDIPRSRRWVFWSRRDNDEGGHCW